MSGVKIFALGVLMAGTLAPSTLAGSMGASQDSWADASGPRSTAAANLAGGCVGFNYSPVGLSTYNGPVGRIANRTGGLVLGTTNSTTAASPINFGNASFRVANSADQPAPSQPAPVQWQPAPSQSTTAPTYAAPPASRADAFIDFGSGPFSEASSLTTGNPQSFLNSPVFAQFYGPGGPSSQDVASFENQVLATVQKTYNDAGLPISLTTDPKASAAHTLSVVSNASNPETPGAIGITEVGGDGYTFIDKFSSAANATQLATAVGHNVAHELMHAFGLADHPEATGPYVDAATATFSGLADPSTGFSPAAASLLSTLDFKATGQTLNSGSQAIDGDQILIPEATPVPEPSTIALWAFAGAVALAYARRKSA